MLLGGGDGNKLQYQLNVTPFIDVMLVLLVIFMMASSAMIADIQINLPTANSSQERNTIEHEVLTVNIAPNGELYVNSKPTADVELAGVVATFKKENEKCSVIVNADKDVHYGRVITVMDALKKNGISRVSLSTKKT